MFKKRMTRMDSNLALVVRFNNQEAKGTVTNISMNGIFSEMEEPSEGRMSDVVEVELISNRPEDGIHIVMECKIARIDGLQYAFQLHAIDYDALLLYKALLSEICGDASSIDEELMAFATGFEEING